MKKGEEAVFGGGCFWCMETAFRIQKGVKEAVSGYSGGNEKNPDYAKVSSGKTGHVEAVKVVYEPKRISYKKLLEIYFQSIDPFDSGGQFGDRGEQYKTAIFYMNATQKKQAEAFKKQLEKKLGKKIVTKILPFKDFFKAEEYHQHFSEKNKLTYKTYEFLSGRKKKLGEIWGKK